MQNTVDEGSSYSTIGDMTKHTEQRCTTKYCGIEETIDTAHESAAGACRRAIA
jgi:hypothetical protein